MELVSLIVFSLIFSGPISCLLFLAVLLPTKNENES